MDNRSGYDALGAYVAGDKAMATKRADRKAGEAGQPTGKGTQSRYAKQTGVHVGDPIRYAELDAAKLRSFIDAVTLDGCAVVLSRTSDGGALAFTLLDGDYRAKEYCSSARDANELMDDWMKIALSDKF